MKPRRREHGASWRHRQSVCPACSGGWSGCNAGSSLRLNKWIVAGINSHFASLQLFSAQENALLSQTPESERIQSPRPRGDECRKQPQPQFRIRIFVLKPRMGASGLITRTSSIKKLIYLKLMAKSSGNSPKGR